jgi:hypothetical protein
MIGHRSIREKWSARRQPVWSATVIRGPIASTRSDAIYWIVVIGGGPVAANRCAPMFRYRRDAIGADSPLDRGGAPRRGHDGHVYIGTIDVEGAYGRGSTHVRMAVMARQSKKIYF